MPITIVATMTVRRDELTSFRDYESRAATVMARHQGQIEGTVFVDDDPASPLVKEVHLVTFPDAEALARYRADPELARWAALRERAVVATEVLVGVAGPSYGA